MIALNYEKYEEWEFVGGAEVEKVEVREEGVKKGRRRSFLKGKTFHLVVFSFIYLPIYFTKNYI